MKALFTDTGDLNLKKRLYGKPSAELPKLAQGLIDQLSVISLCRFKIRETFACDPKISTQDCEAFEVATQEITGLIKEIVETLLNPSCSHIRMR